jgi:hypothetical protein
MRAHQAPPTGRRTGGPEMGKRGDRRERSLVIDRVFATFEGLVTAPQALRCSVNLRGWGCRVDRPLLGSGHRLCRRLDRSVPAVRRPDRRERECPGSDARRCGQAVRHVPGWSLQRLRHPGAPGLNDGFLHEDPSGKSTKFGKRWSSASGSSRRRCDPTTNNSGASGLRD